MIEARVALRAAAGGARSGRFPLRAVIVVALAITLSGCLVLAIPSVAYEGYKYEHQPKAATARTHPAPAPDNSIE
ncbi:MAG TPA: hypothetical protein VND20_05870 [Candidatus Binataceae bacterium]|nr:hypothetical protein [Candidatus Binataceae bacterium]